MARHGLPLEPVWASEAIDLITDLFYAADLVGLLAAQAEEALARAGGHDVPSSSHLAVSELSSEPRTPDRCLAWHAARDRHDDVGPLAPEPPHSARDVAVRKTLPVSLRPEPSRRVLRSATSPALVSSREPAVVPSS